MCWEKYFVEKRSTTCMNPSCDHEWPRSCIVRTFKRSFYSGPNAPLRVALEAKMLDEQRAQFPDTVREIESRKKETELLEQIKALKIEIQERKNKIQMAQNKLYGNKCKPKEVYVGCPCASETCRGYVSHQWKCGLCGLFTCRLCRMLKTDDHTCDPDDVASANLIMSETKPCPQCRAPTFKISGCSQMFCTVCKIAWDYNTGRVHSGPIHNPHYFDWLRQNGGNAPAHHPEECRTLTFRISQDIMTSCMAVGLRDPEHKKVYETLEALSTFIVYRTTHLRYVDAIRAVFVSQDHAEMTRLENIRIQYLLGNLDEKRFGSRVFAANKAAGKRRDLASIIELQIQGVTDIILRFQDMFRNQQHDSDLRQKLSATLDEFDVLTMYTNNLLKENSITYGGKQYTFRYGCPDPNRDHRTYRYIDHGNEAVIS